MAGQPCFGSTQKSSVNIFYFRTTDDAYGQFLLGKADEIGFQPVKSGDPLQRRVSVDALASRGIRLTQINEIFHGDLVDVSAELFTPAYSIGPDGVPRPVDIIAEQQNIDRQTILDSLAWTNDAIAIGHNSQAQKVFLGADNRRFIRVSELEVIEEDRSVVSPDFLRISSDEDYKALTRGLFVDLNISENHEETIHDFKETLRSNEIGQPFDEAAFKFAINRTLFVEFNSSETTQLGFVEDNAKDIASEIDSHGADHPAIQSFIRKALNNSRQAFMLENTEALFGAHDEQNEQYQYLDMREYGDDIARLQGALTGRNKDGVSVAILRGNQVEETLEMRNIIGAEYAIESTLRLNLTNQPQDHETIVVIGTRRAEPTASTHTAALRTFEITELRDLRNAASELMRARGRIEEYEAGLGALADVEDDLTDSMVPYVPMSRINYNPETGDTGSTSLVARSSVFNIQQSQKKTQDILGNEGDVDHVVSQATGTPIPNLSEIFMPEQVDTLAHKLATKKLGTSFMMTHEPGLGKVAALPPAD